MISTNMTSASLASMVSLPAPPGSALLGGDMKQMTQPALAGGGHLRMKQARQRREKRIERRRVATEVATDKVAIFPACAIMAENKRQAAVCRTNVHFQIRLGVHAGCRTHYVAVAHWEDDNIAGIEVSAVYRIFGRNRPARALPVGHRTDHMFGFRHHSSGDHFCTRRVTHEGA